MKLDEYILVHKETGEEKPIDMLFTSEGGDWHKAYCKQVGSMIGCCGTKATKVLDYIFSNLDKKNTFEGTQREIADTMGVSTGVVQKVFKELSGSGYMRNVRHGKYAINSDVISYGSTGNRIIAVQIWNKAK